MPDAVTVEVDGGIAVITIDRPQARNAVNEAVASGIAAAFDELDPRPDVAAMVLTGAGKTFCAGMDLKGFLAGENPTAGGRGFGGITARPPVTPVDRRGRGVCPGRRLRDRACLRPDRRQRGGDRSACPEVTRGLVAAAGGLFRLPRRVPYHLAMEIALTGGHVPAARLHQAGLISALVPAGQALEAARALAAKVAANAPLAVAATKRIIVESADWPRGEAFDRQNAISGPVFTSADAREGAAAFAQKRPPVWRGE